MVDSDSTLEKWKHLECNAAYSNMFNASILRVNWSSTGKEAGELGNEDTNFLNLRKLLVIIAESINGIIEDLGHHLLFIIAVEVKF